MRSQGVFGKGKPLAPAGEATLLWQAIEPVVADYTVFVHLLDADGNTIAQADGQPHSGAYPTTWWEVGEVIKDAHAFPLESIGRLSAGEYIFSLGLYNLDTGERLVVTADSQPLGDHILLGPVIVP